MKKQYEINGVPLPVPVNDNTLPASQTIPDDKYSAMLKEDHTELRDNKAFQTKDPRGLVYIIRNPAYDKAGWIKVGRAR